MEEIKVKVQEIEEKSNKDLTLFKFLKSVRENEEMGKIVQEGKQFKKDQKLESFDQIVSCKVCWNRYQTEGGDHIPLTLNCGHTLCQKCMTELLRFGRVKCPFDQRTFIYKAL